MWLLILIPAIYAILSTLYAYSGIVNPFIIKSSVDSSVGLNMMGSGLAEELVYRGLILYCFLNAWSDRKHSLLLACIASSVVFGASHMFWVIMGKDLILGLLQSIAAIFSGIFYAAIVLKTKSIWPAVLIHGFSNALVYMKLSGFKDFSENIYSNSMDVLLSLPLLLLGILIILKMYPKKT